MSVSLPERLPQKYVLKEVDTYLLKPGSVPFLLLLRDDLVSETARHEYLGLISDGTQLRQEMMANGPLDKDDTQRTGLAAR